MLFYNGITTFGVVLISFAFFCRAMIQSLISQGRIVPSEITVKLLCKAMEESGNDKFLIDGFPRNEENRIEFEKVVRIRVQSTFLCLLVDACKSPIDLFNYLLDLKQAKIEPAFVLFFDCPEQELERRILNRNQVWCPFTE